MKAISYLTAEVLRNTFTESELNDFGVLSLVKHQEESTDKLFRHTIAKDLYEGSFGAPLLQGEVFEIPDYFIGLLLKPPFDKYKDVYRRELIELYTDMGICLPPLVIQKLRQLPPAEQDFIDYAIKRNQDYDLWKAETEELLKKGNILSAFYRIRNQPAFEIYKERLIQMCIEKKDYETLAIICYKRHIFLPELRSVADELLKNGKIGHALAVYFVLQDRKKMEEVARQLS